MLLGVSLLWVGQIGGNAASAGDHDVRVIHAKELLGKYYDHSVVKTAERHFDVNSFVRLSTERNLQGHFKKHSARIASAIIQEANRYGFDPIFLIAVIENESSFNPNTIGSVGEIGLMQIRPTTAEWICKKVHIAYHGKKTLLDPVMNIKIGAAYMNLLRDRFDSHSRLYISAYNMGARNVDKALDKNVWPKEYASAVMTHYVRLYTEVKSSVSIKKANRVIAKVSLN